MFSRYHQNSQWLYANSFSLISQCPVGKALCCEVLRPFDWCTACVEYIWGLSGLLCYLNWCAIKALVVVNIRLMLPYFSLWLNAELVFFLLYRLRWHVCVKRRGWFERSVHYTYRRGADSTMLQIAVRKYTREVILKGSSIPFRFCTWERIMWVCFFWTDQTYSWWVQSARWTMVVPS